MANNSRIRLAAYSDAASILEIYAPFIMDTSITFECEVPALAEFQARMAQIQKKYPWLVCCEPDGAILGYAYASAFNERAAYDWSVDFSIYVRPGYQRRKIGKALYFALTELLKLQGFASACAIVNLPNGKSEGFHQSFGFEPIGVFPRAGFKAGKWHDVQWFWLRLQEFPDFPKTPKTVNEIINTPEFCEIFRRAEEMISD